jgi:hypothetical protein
LLSYRTLSSDPEKAYLIEDDVYQLLVPLRTAIAPHRFFCYACVIQPVRSRV